MCGVTVYDDCHVGHARAYITFDVLRRYLTSQGYCVLHVQNFTDVDDKIIQRAREKLDSGQSLHEACRILSETYIAEYFTVMDQLGILRAHHYPKATEHISHIIALVKTLEEKGFAYVMDGDVYFRVTRFEAYGKLSGRKPDELSAGARVAVNDRKENPLDFVLWKQSKPEEPAWDSPWGMGRPGWHIECSAMSTEYLGSSFDIHGGGKDLIFPHHENEIAQTESATGKPFVKYWIHNGFLTIQKEKMSKSLGNYFTLKDMLFRYEPDAIRLFFLQSHYRHPIDFSFDSLDDAQKALSRFVHIFRIDEGTEASPDTTSEYYQRVMTAMEDDLNTPQALVALFDLAKTINTALSLHQLEVTDAIKKQISLLKYLGNILGLFQQKVISSNKDIEIERLIQARDTARKHKEWIKSDAIRDQLLAQGVLIEDTSKGTRWKKIH